MKSLRIVFAFIALVAIIALPSFAAEKAKTPPAKSLEMTGEHRGYTNNELYVRGDDDKELTFLVSIPGDPEANWHKQFAMFSRITVTYHHDAGEKRPIVTAIRAAAK
jgi:hypothetical protein